MSKYNVGDKFVVEIDDEFDNPSTVKKSLYRVKGFNTLVDDNDLDKLQKYDEEVVATKFYEKGRKEALEEVPNCESYGYNKGLQDAWELARKICGCGKGSIDGKTLAGIFGSYIHSGLLLDDFTYQQALAKIESYEKSQQIEIGDIVRRISDNEKYLIITEEEDDSVYEYGVIDLKSMTIDRITGDLSKFEKTGRHIDIEHLLEQIRGNE